MKYIHSRKSLYNRLLNLSCVIGSIDLQYISIHDNENNLNALHKDLETILDDILEKDEEEEPQTFKFKVGDKVQVLRQSPLAIQGWVGKIGTIIEFDEKRYACYSVKMESGS